MVNTGLKPGSGFRIANGERAVCVDILAASAAGGAGGVADRRRGGINFKCSRVSPYAEYHFCTKACHSYLIGLKRESSRNITEGVRLRSYLQPGKIYSPVLTKHC